ncbi:MAG: methyltransferase domain-containing protein [Cyclobacteriaceae bacterium]|nr:methyltransferase domain-containing protein [Cyclobacteriaceae bacterium]
MHLNSEELLKRYGLSYFKNGIKVLEIGPAGIPSAYQKLVSNSTIEWHTLDLEETFTGLTYIAKEEYHYPIEDQSYDLIITGQVIEHVKKIWLWIPELKRILKKGGILIIINPISWPYHEFPVDCWRIYPEGMKALCDDNQLEILESRFESIEAEHFAGTYTPTVPGQSYTYFDLRKRILLTKIWNALIHFVPVVKKLKVPVEVSYDTITIAKREVV